MSKINEFYLAKGEEGQKRLDDMQKEMEAYNTLSPEQEQAELDNDPGFQQFLDELDSCPF